MKENRDIIEQFLDGELPTDARVEFEQLLQNDADLGREVRAEQAIRSGLERDALSVPRVAAGPSAAVLEKLAGTSAVAGAVGSGSSLLGTLFTTPMGLTFLSLAGAVGLVLGFFLFGPVLREPVHNGPEIPSVQKSSGENAVVLPIDSSRKDLPKASPTASQADRLPSRQVPAEAHASRNQPDSGADDVVEADGSGEGAEEGRDLLDYLRVAKQKEQERSNVIRPDSLRLNLEMEKK